MVETLFVEPMKGMLVLGIACALVILLAIRNPNSSGGIARGILSLLFRK